MSNEPSEQIDRVATAWITETLERRGIEKIPRALFKVVSSRTAHFQYSMLELLLHNRIYMAGRKSFNDVLDSSFYLSAGSEDDRRAYIQARRKYLKQLEIAEDVLEAMVGNAEEFERIENKWWAAALDSVGMYCLTDAVQHQLIWAHYGDAHRGIALCFDHRSPPFQSAQVVRYDKLTSRFLPSADLNYVFVLATKGADWSYEHEWRYLLGKAAGTFVEIPASALRGIILGAKCSEETSAFVISLLERREAAGLPIIELIRASISTDCEIEFQVLDFGDGSWRGVTFGTNGA